MMILSKYYKRAINLNINGLNCLNKKMKCYSILILTLLACGCTLTQSPSLNQPTQSSTQDYTYFINYDDLRKMLVLRYSLCEISNLNNENNKFQKVISKKLKLDFMNNLETTCYVKITEKQLMELAKIRVTGEMLAQKYSSLDSMLDPYFSKPLDIINYPCLPDIPDQLEELENTKQVSEVPDQLDGLKKASKKDEPSILYKVQSGDTLYKIAKKFGTDVKKIKKWNNLDNDMISPKDELQIFDSSD